MLDVASAPLLEVNHVSQSFAKGSGERGAPVLQDVTLSLRSGEIVGLLGRSGCGKSTLLRIVAGLSRPTDGKVTLDGRSIDGPAEGVAMVFQSFALFPWLTVLDNVELGPRAIGVSESETRQRALKAIDTIVPRPAALLPRAITLPGALPRRTAPPLTAPGPRS